MTSINEKTRQRREALGIKTKAFAALVAKRVKARGGKGFTQQSLSKFESSPGSSSRYQADILATLDQLESKLANGITSTNDQQPNDNSYDSLENAHLTNNQIFTIKLSPEGYGKYILRMQGLTPEVTFRAHPTDDELIIGRLVIARINDKNVLRVIEGDETQLWLTDAKELAPPMIIDNAKIIGIMLKVTFQ